MFSPELAEQIAEMARALKNQRLADKMIFIECNADSLDAAGYNRKIFGKSVMSVKRYLGGNSALPQERLQTYGYGETRYMVLSETQEHRGINRRVDF
jgi:outer membrane protein OmpA-like peptidoglycan-associated protein